MSLILGIDPGSRVTGYGVLEVRGSATVHVESGCIRTRGEDLTERLGVIFLRLQEIVARLGPEEAAAEQIFMHRNAASALILGQARGAALAAMVSSRLRVVEYAPARVKQAVTGSGRADKQQVQEMVKRLLSLPERPPEDAADALAVALCHAHSRTLLARLPGAAGLRVNAP